MTKFFVRQDEDGKLFANYVNDNTIKRLDNSSVLSFLGMVQKLQNVTVSFDEANDKIVILNKQDEIIIEKATDFISKCEDLDFVHFLKENLPIKENVPENKEKEEVVLDEDIPKRKKIKKSKSVAVRASAELLAILLAAGIVGFSVKGAMDTLVPKNKKGSDPTPTPTKNEEVLSQVIAPNNGEVHFYSETDFSNIILDYATEKGIDNSIIKKLLYWNNTYSDEKLSFFKELINVMTDLKNSGFNLDVYTGTKGRAILANNGNAFVIIPAKDKNIHSVVELNPGIGTPAMSTYSEVYNSISKGKVPEYIVVGKATSETDYEGYYNNNLFSNLLYSLKNNNYQIDNVGVFGYVNSGETALLNAGYYLKNHEGIKVRVGLLDGHYLDEYLKEYNSIVNGIETAHKGEIATLAYSNAEIISIIPTSLSSGNSQDRIMTAFNQNFELAQKLPNVNILGTNGEDHNALFSELYRCHMFNYLAGIIDKSNFIYQSSYFVPDYNNMTNTNTDTNNMYESYESYDAGYYVDDYVPPVYEGETDIGPYVAPYDPFADGFGEPYVDPTEEFEQPFEQPTNEEDYNDIIHFGM